MNSPGLKTMQTIRKGLKTRKRELQSQYIYIYIYIYGNYKNPDGPKNGARVSLQQNLTSLETP